ncbi:hypothetical protein [Aliarcobacter cryaerophilus]|uniref:hypothetical protein n=1 Tax=Aliarcobacter cryaerophilus TaxID=28198 RepID=UPI0021B27938|nr:hypothetical protein [Aliarcobacter cryaerophilus]MCT7499954.1 hypothetical protein [Aliarcobacter cryaerophilus]MCT7506393.1 hypothetical protein [Aliarcobacter cryaerophilus]MCT7515052.1 hypothetical protein [Aliarcobacter cryaerophilus]
MQNELIEQFTRYNKKEFYQWLVVSLAHPSNQKFGIRYELLIHTLISINEEKFSNKILTREEFEEFISWFEQKYSNHFIMMEDFQPFKQTNLIPLFLDGEKYYFFYGSLERPYEALKQFHEIVFSVNIEELNNIKSEFLFSLQRQTDILTNLSSDYEAQSETTSMYIPSLEFFNKYKSFFEVDSVNIKHLHNSQKTPPLTEIEKMFDFGIDDGVSSSKISQLEIDDTNLKDSIYFYEMGVNNFNGLYTKIDNKFFLIPFESHIETIYNLTSKIIYDEKFQYLDSINDSMFQRMMKILSYYFCPPHRLDGLMDMSKNIHSKYFDTVAQIDANKVLLFKFITHSNNLQNSIVGVAQKSFEELKKMKLLNNLFMFRLEREKHMINMNQAPIDISEIKIIIIFEELTLNYMFGFAEDWKEKNIFIYNSLDIKPILDLLSEKESDNNTALWQYLEAEKKQSSYNNNPMQMDTLDSFAIYYKNESFAIMGKQPDLMMFATHSWSDFYHEYLYKKYQDNIYELVEFSFPNKFNKITHLGNSTYEYIDTSMLDGGRCVKYQNKLIWIVYPSNGFNLKDEEIRVSMFIAEFFTFYIDRYKESIFEFLKEFNFNINTQDFMISIFPDSLVKQNENLEHLLLYANKIDDKENIVFSSQIREYIYNEIFTAVVVTSKLERLENTFGYKEHINPEKYIFEKFIASLLHALNIQSPKNLVSKFIENIWDIKERAFVLENRPVNNAKLEGYQKPLLFQPSFIANVNQEMVNYLKQLSIEPKEYWEEDSKQLNNLIFEFLQKKLEERISQFDSSILIYAYKQIEYIEGKREKEKNQMKFDVEKYIEFDIHERYYKEKIETSELAVSAKHILHTTLKVTPQGGKSISEHDWYYLMACSKIINETIQRSDQLHYRLVETGIEITSSYELIDIDKSSDIDFNAHYKQTTSSQIISAKNESTLAESSEEEKNTKVSSPFNEQLNSAWNSEYGFYLENMIKVMMALGRFEIKKDSYFPLSLLTVEEIFEHLKNIFKETVALDEIKKILAFLSLDFRTYSNYKYIDYSIDRLMRKKERLNLSPFIKIDDKYLFGHQLLLNAIDGWTFPLFEGDSPFSIDDTNLVKKELTKIHDKLDKDLEILTCKEAVKSLGEEFVRCNIDKFQTLSKKFPQKPSCGEIDLLVANPNTKIIFVMDAKNVNQKHHISAIDRELNKFLKGDKSYLVKLNKKFDFIEENKDEILNHFKIEDKNGWKVKKGFVVNTLYVSAFYKEKVDFILIDDLGKFLQQDENL